MEDLRFGVLVRMARIRRGWRQQDLADRAGASRTAVSRIERGVFGDMPLSTVRAVAAPLELRLELEPKARAADIDRILNARHAALAEHVMRWLAHQPGWMGRPEVSFAEYGERGVVDILGWHARSRSVLVIELKTEVIDLGEVLGTLDRKRRLGSRIASRLGWDAASVSACLLIADSMTNRRRVGERAATIRAALPQDGRALRRWLAAPAGDIRALRFVSDVPRGHARSSFAGQKRVTVAARRSVARTSRSAERRGQPSTAP
jgi:transcriptional regulator with XRE-family HTH domain